MMLEGLVLLLQALFGRITGPGADMERIASQPVRRRLLGLIEDQPGIHASELCREVGQSWGTVQYHLSLLRKTRLVQSVEAGRERQFFPNEVDKAHLRLLSVLRQGRRQEIAAYIRDHPGAKQVEICRTVQVSRKTLRASVDPLVEAGLIKESKGLQFNRYFPGTGLDTVLAAEEGAEDPISPAAEQSVETA